MRTLRPEEALASSLPVRTKRSQLEMWREIERGRCHKLSPCPRLPFRRRGVTNSLMRRYYVADLNVRGEVRAIEEYRYEQLEQVPGAAELIVHFATVLYREPEGFETPLPHGRKHMSYRWTATAPTAGISTLRSGETLGSMGLLASGLNPDSDRLTFGAFQRHLLRELPQEGVEPAFDLMRLAERPVVAVVNFLNPPDKLDQLVLALADRCFAAAYFRYQNLA